jgi:hypothetical protein
VGEQAKPKIQKREAPNQNPGAEPMAARRDEFQNAVLRD